MASSTGYREIGVFVDNFVHGWKLSDDDYFVYLKHACDCFRELNTRHNNRFVTVKIAVSALGIIEMPTDMIGFGWVSLPYNGEWVTFTKKGRKVTTTTTTDGVEGQDSTYGEGVDVLDDMYTGVSGRGGVNAYYFNIDWTTRRLTIDGLKSSTAILQYTSSGLKVGESTFIPSDSERVIERYLLWKKSEFDSDPMNKIVYNEEQYDKELRKFRIATWMPSRDEITDVWDSSSSLGVMR